MSVRIDIGILGADLVFLQLIAQAGDVRSEDNYVMHNRNSEKTKYWYVKRKGGRGIALSTIDNRRTEET